MNHYCHTVPGRIRIKSVLVKGNDHAETVLQNLLKDQEGIRKLSVNMLTGSVVVNYDNHKITSDEILKILAESGYFDLDKTVNAEHYFDSAANQLGEKVGKALLGAALDQALGGTPLSLLTALI